MQDHVMLVTGGTSGIGKETVRSLAARGAHVLFTARDEEKARRVQKDIREETGNPHVEYLLCDLASLASVRACANDVRKRYTRLDVLINSAGVLPREREESEDGIELTLAVNFLAPYLLTTLLLPLLTRSAPARIIFVASSMHVEGKIDFDDLEHTQSFEWHEAYAQSKLALLLYMKKLAQDLAGSGVTVNALHPGVVSTEMTMRSVRMMHPLAAFFFKRKLITPAEGALASVYLATSPEVTKVTGTYFVHQKPHRVAPAADDLATAHRLIELVDRRYFTLLST